MWSLNFLQSPHKAWGKLRDIAKTMAVSDSHPVRLSQSPVMKEAIRQWLATHPKCEQQDGSKFCSLVLANLTGVEWGQYEGRRQHDMPEKHSLPTKIGLHMPMQHKPGQSVGLQAVVLQWHEEHAHLQALSWACPIICLQLNRGCPGIKDNTPARTGDNAVLMPVFSGDALTISWTRYRIRAVAMHRGGGTEQGHFNAILHHHYDRSWLADDGNRIHT